MTFEKDPLPIYGDEVFVTRKEDYQNLLTSIVVPRPIAFVTSKGPNDIVNAAPFSYFNIVCNEPSIISISIERRQGEQKDTSRNIAFLKEFVVNICSIEMAKSIAIAARDFPPDISEINAAKLSLIPSCKISVPRIANTRVQMECKLYRILDIGNQLGELVLGEVVAVHLHQDLLISNGRIDIKKLNPIARLSGPTYAKISDFFDQQKDF